MKKMGRGFRKKRPAQGIHRKCRSSREHLSSSSSFPTSKYLRHYYLPLPTIQVHTIEPGLLHTGEHHAVRQAGKKRIEKGKKQEGTENSSEAVTSRVQLRRSTVFLNNLFFVSGGL